MAWTSILAVAGKKLGEDAAMQLINEYGGDNADHYRKILLGNGDTPIRDYLTTVDSRLAEINDTVKATELRQIFAPYNDADLRLAAMYDAFTAHEGKSAEDLARQNACRKVLSSDGAFAQAGQMIAAISHLQIPENKSLLQQYSDLLLRDRNDAFLYYDRMAAIVDHLKIRVMGAAALRAVCLKGVPASEVTGDIPITADQVKAIDDHLKMTIRPSEQIRALFEQLAAKETPIHIQHCNSETYLTGYADGTALSDDEPFTDVVEALGKNNERHGMPQVFVHKQIGKEQIKKYRLSKVYPWLPVREEEVKVTLTPDLQRWQVKLKRVNNETVVMFVNVQSGKTLAGIRQACIYLRPFDENDQSTWWQPVATGNPGKGGVIQYDGRQFMLKHWEDHKALDANGKSVYSGDRIVDHGNKFMKWQIDQNVEALTTAR